MTTTHQTKIILEELKTATLPVLQKHSLEPIDAAVMLRFLSDSIHIRIGAQGMFAAQERYEKLIKEFHNETNNQKRD